MDHLRRYNVEHPLDASTSVDANSSDIRDVCAHHKQRLFVLGQRIEGLPGGHPFKARRSLELSQSFHSVRNYTERKWLLTYTLGLEGERGDDRKVVQTS